MMHATHEDFEEMRKIAMIDIFDIENEIDDIEKEINRLLGIRNELIEEISSLQDLICELKSYE